MMACDLGTSVPRVWEGSHLSPGGGAERGSWAVCVGRRVTLAQCLLGTSGRGGEER
jgi:hypothetical protein